MEYVIVPVAVLAAFYFILLRPVINQQRRQRRDISSLEIGDEVLTTGGFYAVVNDIHTFEDRPMEIVLEAAPGVMLRGTTSAIAMVARRRLSDEEPDPAEKADEDDEKEDDEEEWDEEDEDDLDWDDDDDEEDLDEDEDWDDDEDDEDWEDDDEEDDVDDVEQAPKNSSPVGAGAVPARS